FLFLFTTTYNTRLYTLSLHDALPILTLQAASAGFKNQGQFIAALHVSHNLNIPFDQLKAKLTGPGELRFQLIKRDVQIVRYVQCRDELPLVLESGRGCLQRQDRKSVV